MDLEKKEQLERTCSNKELVKEIIQYIEYLEHKNGVHS